VEELHLTKKDFRIDWFSGQGAGGQHRNKHQNCCRITHIESGLSAVGQNSRSRVDNQREAFTRLVSKILALGDNFKDRNFSDDVVRTYHFERNVATDGSVSLPVQSVLDGDIEEFLKNSIMGLRPERKTGRV
jgi:protein subunit release factor A